MHLGAQQQIPEVRESIAKNLPLQFNFQCKRNKNVKMHFKYFSQMAKFFSIWLSTSFLVLVRRAAAGRAARRTARSKSVCCPCCLLVCIRPLCTSANDNSATLTFFDHFDKRLWLLQEEYLRSWKKRSKKYYYEHWKHAVAWNVIFTLACKIALDVDLYWWCVAAKV